MGDRNVRSDKNKKILYMDTNILYGHSMCQPLPYDEVKIDKNVKLEDILNTPDDKDIGYFIEFDLEDPDEIKENTMKFSFAPEKKPDDFSDYMRTIKPDFHTQTKKMICDWSDKKNYLIHYRKLNFYVRHGMIVDKIPEKTSFKQSKSLEKFIIFNTQKKNQAVNDFEKDFYKLPDNAFYGKAMEIVRRRFKIKFFKKDDTDKNIKQ